MCCVDLPSPHAPEFQCCHESASPCPITSIIANATCRRVAITSTLKFGGQGAGDKRCGIGFASVCHERLSFRLRYFIHQPNGKSIFRHKIARSETLAWRIACVQLGKHDDVSIAIASQQLSPGERRPPHRELWPDQSRGSALTTLAQRCRSLRDE